MLPLLVVCVAIVATDDPIWAETIAAQPFDVRPFRAVKIPPWVESTIGAGYTLSGMDTQSRTLAARHGVTISEMGFVDPFYAYYDSKLLKRRSPHVPLDRLPKDIAEYKRLNVRILGVYPPCLQGEVYEGHPEWRRIATDTTEIPSIDMQKFPHGGMLCLLGPYGDFFIDVLAEIVTTFPDVDAFSFDGPDNITVSPYGGVILAEDGEGIQHLIGVTAQGKAYLLARNEHNDSEFTGPTFSADGRILFACIQSSPGYVFAITGPWGRPVGSWAAE